MKLSNLLLLLVVIPNLLVPSCGNPTAKEVNEGRNGTESDEPSRDIIRIVSQIPNSRLAYGDNILLSFEEVIRGVKPDSIKVWFDGEHYTTLPGTEKSLIIDTRQAEKVGRKQYRISAYQTGFRPQVITGSVELLSDIIPEIYTYKVKRRYPHDPKSYTQGLLYDNGDLYESTGGNGSSWVRRVELATGKPIEQVTLEPQFFGEGIALVQDMIYHLTWTSKVGFVYEKESLRQVKRIFYQNEGWGLTNFGEKLIMSDGSNKMWIMNPYDFSVAGSFEVYDNSGPVFQLNELENIRGEIWANLYTTDRIARIDASTGRVLAYIDLAGLLPQSERTRETDVLNGIAWDEEGGRIFVTGKLWPSLYEIELIKR